MTRRLLVPVGHPELARVLASHVEPILRGEGAEAELLHVGGDEEGRAALLELTAGLRENGLPATARWVQGEDVAAEILAQADALKPWLVVMATHGTARESRRTASVTARVLHDTVHPLLIFNPWSLGRGFKRFLVPLDGSPASRRILRRTEELAQIFGAEVVLLRVLSPEASSEDYEHAEESLDRDRGEFELAGVHARVRVLAAQVDVAGAILAAAAETEADLIAMTTHGHTLTPLGEGADAPLVDARWPFGTVAEKVLRHSTAPLLIERVVHLAQPRRSAEPAPAPPPRLALEGADLPKRILVPLDGSDLARRSLPLLSVLLQGRSARVVLLGVGDDVSATRARLEAVSRGLAWRGLEAEVLARPGDPAEEILRVARDVNLVLMSSHGRSGVSRWVRGSVAERVLRGSAAPVLVSNPDGLADLLGPEDRFRAILVPHDGSERARRALPLVATLAILHTAEVHLLQAVDLDPGLPTSELQAARDQAEEELREDADALRQLGLSVRVLTEVGKPAEEILAASGGVDLVAMTTHGRTGPGRWIYGSVAESILRTGARPLLVFR